MLLKHRKVHKPFFVIASCIAFLCILGFLHDQGWVKNAKAAVSSATVPPRVSAAGDQKPLTNNCINPSVGDACINVRKFILLHAFNLLLPPPSLVLDFVI